MPASQILIGAVLSVAFAAAFLFSAAALASRASSPVPVTARWLSTVGMLLWLPTALFQGLAALRWFTRPGALAALAVLVALSWRAVGGRAGLLPLLERDRVFARRTWRLVVRSPYRHVMFACAVAGLSTVLRTLVMPPLGHDTLTYHAVKAGMWVQNGGVDSMIGPGTWAYYRNMLPGGEVFLAWAMLPMRSDTLAGLVEVAQWLGLFFSTTMLARRLRVREPFASSAAVFLASVPTVRLIVGSGYVEVGLLLALVTAIALGLDARRRRRPAVLAIAAAVLGVLAATKFPMVPVAALLLALLLVAPTTRGPAIWRRWALAGVVAFSIALAPWLVRTTARTGAPFSPVPLAVGPVVLGTAPPEVQWYTQRPTPAFNIAEEADLLRRLFAVPGRPTEALGFLVVVALIAAVPGVRPLVTREPFGAALVLLTAALCLALYLTPGFAFVRFYFPTNQARFLLPAVAMIVVTSVAWCGRGLAAARWYRVLLAGMALWYLVEYSKTGFSPVSVRASFLVLVGALGFALGAWWLVRRVPPRSRRATLALWAALGVVALHGLRTTYRHDLLELDFAIHPAPKYWARAMRLMDDGRTPRRVAITSGPHQWLDSWVAYPFMGTGLQNVLVHVPVSRDGRVMSWGPGEVNARYLAAADYEAWHRRLHEGGVTDVVSFGPAGPELRWLASHPEAFEPLDGVEGHWGAFRVRRP